MNIIFPSTLIVLSIGAVFMYVSPQFKELSSLRQTRTQYSQSVEKIDLIKKKYEEVKQWQDGIRQNDLKRIGEILPEEFDNVQFLLDLNLLSARNSIVVGAVDIGSSEKKDAKYVTHTVSFSFDAPYSLSATNFLKGLEKSLTVFDVIDFSITNSDNNRLSYSLVFNTYSLK